MEEFQISWDRNVLKRDRRNGDGTIFGHGGNSNELIFFEIGKRRGSRTWSCRNRGMATVLKPEKRNDMGRDFDMRKFRVTD